MGALIAPRRCLLVVAALAAAGQAILGAAPMDAAAAHAAPAYKRIGAPRLVQIGSLPRMRSSALSPILPFRPRSPLAFERAKRAAAAGATGRRTGLATVAAPLRPATAPRVASPTQTGPGLALQVEPTFDLTSRDQQVSWFNPSNDQAVTPPDTQLAAGPSDLLEMTNSSASIWSKSGILATDFDLYPFYGVDPATTGLTDPRATYDAASGRWFATAFSFSLSSNASTVWLAVSQSGDPAVGNWKIYNVSSNASLIQDQPKFGVTADKLVITWNDFNGTTNPFAGEETVVIEKADLLSSPMTQPRVAWLTQGPDPARYNLIPAQAEDGASVGYLVGNGSADGLGPFARLIPVTGTPAAGNVAWSEQDLGIAPTAVPPPAKQGPGPPPLATNDDAFISAAVKNGILWVAGNDGCSFSTGTTNACARLIQISVTGRPAVSQDLDLGQGGNYDFFPAVAIDSAGNMVVAYTASADSSYAGVAVSGQAAGAVGAFVSGYNVQNGLGAYSCGTTCANGFNGERWGDFSSAAPDPASPGSIWVAGEYGTQPPPSPTVFTSDNWGTAAGEVTFAPSGLMRTAVSSQQYQLANSDGQSWTTIDPTLLSTSITPSASGQAVLDANADLWTANAGYNQDLGIAVSPSDAAVYPQNIVAWKESGGFAGTFSPNAAFVQGVIDVTAGTTYTVTLKWKTNKPATGASIFAGAGTAPSFSPTRLTVRLAAGPFQSVSSTDQFRQIGNSGSTWVPLGPTLHVHVPADTTGAFDALVSGNADLWTTVAGYNQDIGLQVVSNGVTSIEGWKESGGRSGTFSPNAAFVQTVLTYQVGNGFDVTLVWKTNRPEGVATILAGAGTGPFSPTRLTVELVPKTQLVTFASTSADQYSQVNSDGQSWLELGTTFQRLTNALPPGPCLAIISVNVDLWTATAGVNQDIGIAVDSGLVNHTQVVAWKESGGSAGTFSPNAAYLETVVGVQGGHSITVFARWKANFPTGGEIRAAAGTSGAFSPTRLTLQWVCS